MWRLSGPRFEKRGTTKKFADFWSRPTGLDSRPMTFMASGHCGASVTSGLSLQDVRIPESKPAAERTGGLKGLR